MGRKKVEIFSQKEWDEAGTLDRIYMYLLEPERWHLNEREFQKMEELRQVWVVMCDNMVQRDRIKKINGALDEPKTERTVKKLMEDAQYLFGDVLSINVDLELHLLKERYYELAKAAQARNEYDVAKKCLDGARDLVLKLKDKSQAAPAQLPEIVFTDNPLALNEPEDADFEEIDLLEPQATPIPQGNSEV